MPPPKDPEKLAEYREKMRRIALERGYGKWMTGKKLSPETIEKVREASIKAGNDPDERQRRSDRAIAGGYGKWMEGKTLSAEHRAAIGAGVSGSYEERYGDRAEEERAKRRNGNRERWVDVPRKPQRDKHNADHRYKDWRTAVFQRDDYTCRECGQRGGHLHAHHILRWATHPEARYDVDNGLTLHETCHRALHKREDSRKSDTPNNGFP
ncbi:HNH endonuclease [Rhodococcoides fascians]|uniref:HNH endonuclease n=1 Tax=Rhodococcoides fascians TaxID=1828 RepID=UPI00068ED376|nr:HNH endonuclease [Rhodococcus fascians]